MENGVQNVDKSISEVETKTADGGVSQLKLGDNVVQVFPELKDSEGDDVGVSSVETKLADGGVSQLKLGENVVQVFPEVKDFEDDDVEMMTPDAGATPLSSKNVFHVFHEAKDIEGDDVFEEAMMDVHPDEHTEKVESKEAVANGDENVEKIADADRSVVRSSNEAQDGEKVKEAVELDVPSEEAKTPVAVEGKLEALEGERPVDEVRVADEVVHDGDENVEQIGNLDSLAVNGATNEVFKADKVGDENAEQVGTTDSLAVNGGNKEVLEGDKVGEAGESSLPNEDQSSQIEQPIRVKEELKTLVDADPADMVRVADVVVDENLSKKVLAEEAPERVFVEGDVDGHSIGVVDGKKVSSGNGELESGVSCDAAVNVNSENGDLDKLKLEQKSNVPPKSSEVDQVSPDEIKLSEGNESNDQILWQEDQSSEMRDIGANMDTSLNKDMESQEIESVVRNLDGPVDKETEGREIKSLSSVERLGTAPDERVEAELIELEAKDDQNHQPDERVEAESIELEAKDDQNHQAHHISESIEDVSSKHVLADKPEVREIQNDLSDNHVVSEEPEVQEIQDDRKEQVSPSIEELKKLKSAREPEIQPAVEPAQPPPPPRPAGLGGAAPLLDPAPRAVQQSRVNGAIPQRQAQLVEDSGNGEAEENDETREKLQMIRVKFLRLAHRLGQTPHNVVVAQVLYRLGLAEQLRGRNASRAGAFSFDRASAMAEQIEAAGQEPLDFSCTIMVLGKTGVGKSATINSIFDEVKFSTDAFQMGTRKVQDVVGTVQGIKVRVIDTPGLLPCWSDQKQNEKILHSVKRFIKKNPPDIVLYLDRLDMQSRDFGDLPLLRTITEIFGPSIWFNAIVVLTHAASAPPDGPNGIASSYEMFVTQRSHVVQQAIRQAAGDMRLMNPVSLVENHSACRTNRAGQRVLPNGQVWKPHLLLLSFASKILAEANTLLKLQDNPPGKPFASRSRVPPLPFLLSSLLQSRPQLKLPEEQLGGEDDLDEDLDESSDSDGDSDYDDLPPFKALTKAQLAKLSKAQKKAYFDELEYREKLFMKKQLRDEKRRRKLLKKMAASAKDLPNDYNESAEEDSGGAASVPVAMPDFTLPASFDSDNPTHRYRFLDTSNQWLVRPVLETHGWDHDVGYEGINVERLFVVKDKVPLSFSGQVTKDKKESNLQMEVASSIKHNEGKATSVGFDMQTVGKDMAYTLRSETRFSNFRHNKAAAGLSVTLLGDALTAGVKVEDRLIVNKRFRVVLTGGAMTGRGEVAYGGSLEATLRDKDYPLGRALSTLALSIMDWHGDLALGCNVQSQIPIGRTTNVITRANLNNRGSGQVSIRLNSAEQLQVALIGLLPLFKKIAGHYQQMLYGE